jgi:hypothetical protein
VYPFPYRLHREPKQHEDKRISRADGPGRRALRSLAALTLTSLSFLVAAPDAHAAGEKDKEALKLHDQAMDEDYLAVEFAKAEKKLKDALKKCGADGCTPKVLGKLHIAMGTVHGANNKLDLAKESFVAALKADPEAKLNESLTTPELAKSFAAAQKQVGVTAKPGGGDKPATPDKPVAAPDKPVAAPDKPAPEDGGDKKPAGDLSHTPPAEQAVNTPVPIYIEIPEEVGAVKATVRYRPFGGNKWKTLEMQRVGKGYGAEIPCEDVTTTGDIKYFIIAKDDAGDPVGTAGSMKEPYKVPIKNEIEGDEPSLPGKKPPEECAAKEDCPPGLPGCPGGAAGGAGVQRGDKGWGSSCEQTQECKAGLVCLNGSCEEDTGGTGGTTGPTTPGKAKKNIIGLWGQLDLLLITGSEDVCSGSDPSYVCFDPDNGNAQFYGLPTDQKATNGIQGGFSPNPSGRIMLSYDRQLVDSLPLTLGLRIGYAFGGSPSQDTGPSAYADEVGEKNPHAQANPFLPIHAEARATYFFGPNAFEHKKLRPFVFLGGGLAQVNQAVPVSVCDTVTENGELVEESDGDCKPVEDDKGNTRQATARKLDAYQITGLNFIGVGGGLNYGITPNIGVSFELKVMFMVPTFGVVFAPTLGPVFAF